MERTYNPCDECEYAFHKNNQESSMCRICEYKQVLKELKAYRDAEEQGLLVIGDNIRKIAVTDRNKAIDDFTKEIVAEYDNDGCPNVTDYLDYRLSIRELFAIAEQMKEV